MSLHTHTIAMRTAAQVFTDGLLLHRDALETCSTLDDGASKEACYATFGCDGNRVERYYTAVEDLETAWEQGALFTHLTIV